MKKLSLFIVLLLAYNLSYGQESFKKKYSIPSKFGDSIHLLKDSVIMFNNMNKKEREKITTKYKDIDFIEIIADEMVNGNKVVTTRKVRIDSTFLKSLSTTLPIIVTERNLKGFVKFEEDGKLLVNRYLKVDSLGNYTRSPINYYQLKNRESISLWFTEFSFSALLIPVKYRLKGKNNLPEDFSTAVNGNIFIGYSAGKTSFFHQEKVGNKTNTWKLTGGLLFGASSVVIDKSNTYLSTTPILDDKKITKGLVSLGVGAAFTFNKINLGVFYGFDSAIGDDASKWNYNKKPWLGFAIGYSLFNF